MDKKRLEIIITSVLVLLLIITWVNSIKTVKKKLSLNKSILNAASEAKPSPTIPLPGIVNNKDVSWVRDPFSGKLYGSTRKNPEDPHSLSLAGIIWDKEKPLVLINNKVAGVGDYVSGNIVVSIKNDRVILNDGVNDFEIRIGR
jgi:hypothetical protein